MSMTGVLSADFSAFTTAADKAVVSLKGMEGGALKTGTALDNMSTGAVAPMNTFRSSVGLVDQALAASGVNVGKYARGFAEITEMSGKTVNELGLLAAGAGVVAAAMAGWNFGRAIAGFFDLDTKIANATASLMGWGNMAAEVGGAKMDVINRAIANGAAATISYTDAIAFNIQHVKDQGDAYAVSSERLAAAQKEVRGLSDAQIAGIEIAQRNHATVEQITKAYGISADGLKALADRQKLAGQMADAHTKSLDTQAAAVKKLDADYAKLMSDVSNANQLAIMEADAANMAAEALHKKNAAAAGWIAQQVAIKKGIDDEAAATKAYLTEQDALTAATDALGQAHTDAGGAAVSATAGAVAGYQGVAQAVNISGDAIKEWIRLMQYSAQVNAILSTNSLFTTTSQLDLIAGIGGGAFASRGGRGGAGGGAITVNINAMGDAQDIGRRTKEGIVAASRAIGQRLPEA